MNMTMKRLQILRTILSEKNIQALLISQPENRYYLSNFSGSAGYLLIMQDKQLLSTDFRYVEQVKRQSPAYSLFEIKGEMTKWFPSFSSLAALQYRASPTSGGWQPRRTSQRSGARSLP